MNKNRKPHPADRNRPSGLYGEQPLPPQLVDFVVSSGAMRSRSEDYVPAVVFDLTMDDDTKFTCMMRVDGPEMEQISKDILEAVMHARKDVRAAQASQSPGQGKSHG